MIPLGVMGSAGAMGGVKLTNMLTNSDFSNGLVGWSGIDSIRAEVAGVASVTTTGVLSSSGATSHHLHQAHPITSGKKYYLRARVKSQASHYLRITTAAVASVVAPTENVWRTLSGIYASGVTAPRAFGVVIGGTEHPYVFEADQFVAINLTDAFGAGNEPSKETMDILLASKFPATNGWFDGTTTLDLVIEDSFNRPNGPLILTETGHSWVTEGSAWVVSGNRAVVYPFSSRAIARVDTGSKSMRVRSTINRVAAPFIVAGYVDISNTYQLTALGSVPYLELIRRVSGVNTLLSEIIIPASADVNCALEITQEAGGTRLKVYVGDDKVRDILDTMASRPQGTWGGVAQASNNVSNYHDNFRLDIL